MKNICEKGSCEKADLRSALAELVTAIELRASARAKPETYYSPRMEEAIERAKKLIHD